MAFGQKTFTLVLAIQDFHCYMYQSKRHAIKLEKSNVFIRGYI
jgi:hypothetical protein